MRFPKPILEDLPAFDIAEAKRNGLWDRGACWINGTLATVGRKLVELRYGRTDPQRIELIEKLNPLCGPVHYLACPSCREMCRKVHYNRDRWECWRCTGHVHASRRGSRREVLERRLEAVNQRIRRANHAWRTHEQMTPLLVKRNEIRKAIMDEEKRPGAAMRARLEQLDAASRRLWKQAYDEDPGPSSSE